MIEFIPITEQESHHRHLEKMPVAELLTQINAEDQLVAPAVARAIPQLEKLIEAITDKLLAGGRLFYIGAGTSGRLAVVDASECPPTFGVPPGLIVAVIAGGAAAITQAVEHAEDSTEQGWTDLMNYQVSPRDVVVGLAASGTTPYVVAAVQACCAHGIVTGGITNNPGAPLARAVDFPVEIAVGAEFITGSTRMKSGTAQKLVLNMISTAVMIQLGRVEDNKMVHMQLTNDKLVDRGTKMIMHQLNLADYEKAKALLLQFGSVKKAVEHARN